MKLPARTGKEVVGALEAAGFAVVRTRSSHHFLRHPDGRTRGVPVRDYDITREAFASWL